MRARQFYAFMYMGSILADGLQNTGRSLKKWPIVRLLYEKRAARVYNYNVHNIIDKDRHLLRGMFLAITRYISKALQSTQWKLKSDKHT